MPLSEADVPDVLDLLGLTITEVGSAHVGVEWARRWPSGAGRVVVVVQSAYSGALLVDLALAGPAGQLASRQVALAHGEVRRCRLPFDAAALSGALILSIKAPVPAGASRLRPVWVRSEAAVPTPGSSVLGALFGALKQAVGRGGSAPTPASSPVRELPLELQGVEGEPPIAAEEEVVWQVGMDAPPQASLAIGRAPGPAAPPPATEPAVAAPADDGKASCLSCHGRFYRELVREAMRCPGCGQSWEM